MTPVVQLMKKKGNEYKGFMYAGCMMTQEGPKIIEFNIRFGDPECQPAMMMIKNGLYQPLSLALEGKLDEINIEFNQGGANCVVLASQGYPGDYEKGLPITGIDDANSLPGVKVFHAGTKKDNKDIVTAGGRVLGVTAYSKHGIQAAQTQSYKAVSAINIPNGFAYRLDIGDKGIT